LKIYKLFLHILIGIAACLFIGINTVHAVDLDIWEGAWFSVTVKANGFFFPSNELENKPRKISGSDKEYLHIDSVVYDEENDDLVTILTRQ